MNNFPTSSTHQSSESNQDHLFPCLECGKVFAQKRSLLRHDQAKHWQTKFHCACLKSFTRRDHLVRHQKFCNGQIKIGTITDSYPNSSQPELDRKGLPTTKDFKFKRGNPHKMDNSTITVRPWTPYQRNDFPHKVKEFKNCPVTGSLIIPGIPRIKYIPTSTLSKADIQEDLPSTTRATSSPIPGTSHEGKAGDLMASLFGDCDSDTDPEPINKPPQSASTILLSEDLNLSASSLSSLDISLDDISPPADTTPTPDAVSTTETPASIQTTLLKVVDDLMEIQKFALLDNPPDLSFFKEQLSKFYDATHDTVKATSDKYT